MLRRLAQRLVLVLAVGAGCWLLASAGEPVAPGDAAEIEHAIRSQLHAIAEGDAVRAFELTTPSIRAQMGSAENFYRLIRDEYSPIFHHVVVIFAAPELQGDVVLQAVRLTDNDSRVWLALYSMQRDAQGQWQVDGCQLVETDAYSI